MKQSLKVCVIGAGKWGRNLIKALAKLEVLSAIVDINEKEGYQLALSYQVNFFKTIEDVLEKKVDIFVIATPVVTHYALTKKLLLAKKDVFVEKPITTEVEQADELINLAEKNNCILMVGHLLLYQPCIQFIKEFLSLGKLGKIYAVKQTRRSLGRIRKEENVLYSLGVHDLAVLDYLISAPLQNIQVTSQEIISPGIADDMTIHLHYAGLQASLHLCWLWPVKDRQLMILGEKGTLFFNEIEQRVIHYPYYVNPDLSIVENNANVLFHDPTPPLILELQHFLQCVVTRQTPRSCGRQGRDVVKLMNEIMKIQQKVEFDELQRA